jgi:hypothetical protein
LEGLGPENQIKLTKCNIEYKIQNTAAVKLMYQYIKLPMYRYLFMILMGANPFRGPTPFPMARVIVILA